MHHVFGIVAAVVLLLIVVKGFVGSFWRKPPSRQDSTATDWSSYIAGDSVNPGPTDQSGNS